MTPFALAMPEHAPRYAPATLRAHCPHCGVLQRVVVEGRHDCAGRPYLIITPATLRAIIAHAKQETPQ